MTPDELVRRALDARALAYAPYSKFRVGAALLADDGRVFVGANVENASYGLTNCAERSAVFQAVNAGARRFRAIAIATEPGASMCGACRQVVREFAPDLAVYLAEGTGRYRVTTLTALLPDSFGPESLGIDPTRDG